MTEPLDRRERRQLCDVMLELGADAPTLCEGWTVADLAAHLVLREHFRRSTRAAITRTTKDGAAVLVARLREDPPLPWRVPWLRDYVTGFELFVHHEDVRRANGYGARPTDPDVERVCARLMGYFARTVARRLGPFTLEVAVTGGRPWRLSSLPSASEPEPLGPRWAWSGGIPRFAGTRRARPKGSAGRRRFGSGPVVTVSGRASEIDLYLIGRRAAAEVTVEGSAEAVTALNGVKAGL